MKILVVHNRYRERGGEDRVVELEGGLLRRHGHQVTTLMLDNHDVEGLSSARLAVKTIWNHDSYRAVRQLIRRERPDVMHVHNTLPLASPAVYYAAAAEGVPVVQTVHNYRLLCPNGLCLRDGVACTTCVGRVVPVAAVRHGCYRGSRAATTAVAAMLVSHRVAGTWTGAVDTYIAPTEFARRLLVSGGLPAARVVVKPHFVDPVPPPGTGSGGNAIYVGRLSPEKGIDTLLSAWPRLAGRVPLTIVGDGPMAQDVATAARQIPGVQWLGHRDNAEVQALIADAAVLILPSLAFETFGQVVVEALAAGTPVIVSDAGAAAELVDEGRTGLRFRTGDAEDLAAQVTRMMGAGGQARTMRTAARAAYEARFTGDANHAALMTIYEGVRSGSEVAA